MPEKYISPWSRSEAQRRRASVAGRNTWKQQEPQPKSKPKQYFVLGMEVDYNTYREFMYNREYRIDGDILKDVVCWLPMLERYATEEHAKDYPIEAENARKILDQIREEITTITGKDDKNMKKPRTAADFIDALNDIYTATRATYTEANKKLVNARAKMEKAERDTRDSSKDNRLAEAQYLVAKGEFQMAENEARRGYHDMIDSYDKQVKELRTQFAAHLDDHYAANPDRLDANTMQLLGSGICTPVELARLVDRHQGNPTMLRIVGEYARKLREDNRRNMNEANKAICSSVSNAGFSAKDGSRELAIFDSAVSATKYGLGKDYNHATRMDSHMGGWFDDFKQNLNNLPVIPEEMAPNTNKEE